MPHRVYVAVGGRREPVWHQVHQTDPSGQSRWYLAQPQRWAGLCRKIELLCLRYEPLFIFSLPQCPFKSKMFVGFYLCGPVGPGKFEGRFLVWAPDSTRSPSQQQPTHAHQVKSSRLSTTSGRFCPSTTAAQTSQPLVTRSLQHMSMKACDSCYLRGPPRILSHYFCLPFSPQNFSAAGPFKACVSGDSDLRSNPFPPPALPLENGAASQPIRTPARVKKVKGHHR